MTHTLVGEVRMGAVLPPGTKLSFPYDTTTCRIRIPRSDKLFDLHVAAPKDMQREIFFVDEVRYVGPKLLIEKKRDAIVSRAGNAEVDELLPGAGFTEVR